MATIQNVYLGDLRTEALHVKSAQSVMTDAPLDNQGKGETFSPTDLMAASLGACMLTIMGIRARDAGIDIEGVSLETTKIMSSKPRRVSELRVEFKMPKREWSEEDKKLLENAALTCPVALSLSDDLQQVVHFNW